jgi:hypothetical protein
MVTPTLTTILKMVEVLPVERQKRVEDHLRDYIADMDDEERWDDTFARTQDKLARMTRDATRQISEGKSEPMNFNRL